MSWATALCDLYDKNAWRAGEVENWNGKPLVLLPMGYTTVKAVIEVEITADGCFHDARKLQKGTDIDTLAPATEKSMSRTSTTVAPHPLFDSLKYLAGDFFQYVDYDLGEKELVKKKNHINDCFAKYETFLKEWCNSEYSCPIICAINRYISKRALIADLLSVKGILNEKNGRIQASQKINSVELEKATVRFRVFSDKPDKNYESRVWLNKAVQESFSNYYASITTSSDLCYISGDRMRTTSLLPKKIRYDMDGSKLISSNDNTNFSYRGRFNTKDKDTGYNEALSIGYETSQKIHNALKWIIRRQGYTRDGACLVSWESDLRHLPQFYGSAVEIIGVLLEQDEYSAASEDELFGEAEENTGTGYVTANDFNMALDGYSKELADTSQMYVLALDSASPGRLALVYFKELSSSRYLNSIRLWQESCRWRQEYFNKEKKFCRFEGITSIKEIAYAVYGTEQNKRLKLRSNSDGKTPMLISMFDRLRPCIIDGVVIPNDIVKSAVMKASNPVAYEKTFNYLRVLHTACSLVKKFYWDKGVRFDMILDETCNDRSYLYGRLLAVAEKVERCTYEKGETRTTNAERYMQQFSRTPMRTWEIIRRNTQIYLKQLKPGSREYYKNLYGSICVLFEDGAFESKAALDGKYLLGYDCQREALKKRKTDDINTHPDTDETDDNDKEEN